MYIVNSRFIPACTGNTSWRFASRGGKPVHPRVYGEYAKKDYHGICFTGSSPCVRGILALPVCPGPGYRFIPACTGNTSTRRHRTCTHAVHPRVYGEYVLWLKVVCEVCGSSPRVRGIQVLVMDRRVCLRFIPACTGNTGSAGTQILTAAVHPRVYGEYYSNGYRIFLFAGSSPRVRGIQQYRYQRIYH